jgi:DNA-binding FadR family transcriptional regulator
MESAAAGLAAELRTEHVLLHLDATFKPLELAIQTLEELAVKGNSQPGLLDSTAQKRETAWLEFRCQDNLFHLTIARAAGDGLLYELVEELRAEWFATFGPIIPFPELSPVTEFHRMIFRCIRDMDASRAERAMFRHMGWIHDCVMQMLQQDEDY